jgi:gluconate 2-dehydrogenase gamma chain
LLAATPLIPTPVWAGAGCGSASAALPATSAQTLAAVLAHLLPSESEAPGAVEIQALAYLAGMLGRPDFDGADPDSLLHGAAEIERLAQVQAGRPFTDLTEAGREAVLRAYETTEPGRRWLGGLLGTLLEALLGDPIYGGNPDGIGWRWLGHAPGFPRPSAEQRYFRLPT